MSRNRALGAFAWALGAALTVVLTAAGASAEEAKLAPHPRVVLNTARVQKLANLASAGDNRYVALKLWGDENLHAKAGQYLAADFEGAGWAQAAENYALLYLLTRDGALRKAYADEAIVYMRALADDLDAVGDGKGGLAAAQAGEGYAIRNRGIALAAAYDWLYGYEDLNPLLQKHFVDRLNGMLDWYESTDGGKGAPWDSRFAAYLCAKAFTAAATYEDNPKARESYLPTVVAAMKSDILPALSKTLAGGYCPEGWAYRCGYDRTIDAVITLDNATGESYDTSFFPFVVRAVIHSTKPDRKHIYDGGDWAGDVAGYPLPLPLMSRLAALLKGTTAGSYASYYVFDFAVHDAANNVSLADSLLYLDPEAERVDFTKTEPLSYFSPGTGLVTYRSAWSEKAFWGSFQSGAPRLSPRQHDYQGHITTDYLGSDILIDAGVWHESLADGKAVRNNSPATALHNTITIGSTGPVDGASQSAHGEGKALAFEDGAGYVYASADITGAYSNEPPGAASSAARKVTREVFYIRPTAVVISDTVEPASPGYWRGLVFNFPFAANPKMEKASVMGTTGDAAFRLFSVSPAPPAIALEKRFGTNAGDEADGVYTWRATIGGKTGDAVSRFLTVFSAAKAVPDGTFAGLKAVFGGPNGAVLSVGGVNIAVIWAAKGSTSFAFQLPAMEAMDIYVIGMEPNKAYSLGAIPSGGIMNLRVDPSPGGQMSSAAGVFKARVQPRGKTGQ